MIHHFGNQFSLSEKVIVNTSLNKFPVKLRKTQFFREIGPYSST